MERTHRDSLEPAGVPSTPHPSACQGQSWGQTTAGVPSFSPQLCSSPLPHRCGVGCQPDGSSWGWLVDADPAFPWGPKCANVSFSLLTSLHIV